MTFWLVIAILGVSTLIFWFCIKRIYDRRYCQKTFFLSFQLLRLSYFTCYIEATYGIVISSYLFLNNYYISPGFEYMIGIILVTMSSKSSVVRMLRQYRIFLLTYIEKGLFDYHTLLKRKSRLTHAWNYKIILVYMIASLIISVPLITCYQSLTSLEYYSYMTYLVFSLKLFELINESLLFFLLMDAEIPKIYRVETLILLAFGLVSNILLISLGMYKFLTFGVLAIMKVSFILFNDIFICNFLIKDREKKPLLPPIYLINSVLFATEIHIVYQEFRNFLQSVNNKKWIFLLDFLMQIRMLDYKSEHMAKPEMKKILEKIKKDDAEIWGKMDLVKKGCLEEEIKEYSCIIIAELDEDAFQTFMGSSFYNKIEKRFNQVKTALLEDKPNFIN